MSFISKLFISLGLGVASLFGWSQPVTAPSFGATFTPVGGQTYTLSGAGVTATQNIIPLTSFTTPDGRAITMSMLGSIGYGTLEPNTTSKIEDITFTGVTQNANGTAVLTGVTRGADFVSPYAGSTTLSKAHVGGSYFILSNTAGFYGQQFLFANNPASSTATLTFSNTNPPFYYPGPGLQSTGTYNATTSEFASITYVNQVVAAGAANATNAVKGIVQLATAAQAALGTALGSTGANLVLPSSLATSTPGVQATNVIPVTGTNQKLSQSFLDLTQAFNVSGLWTFNSGFLATASSTHTATTSIQASSPLGNALRLNGVPLGFPSSQCPTGQTWINDGSGNLSCGYPGKYTYYNATGASVTAGSGTAYATSTSIAIPASVLNGSSTIQIIGTLSCGGGGGGSPSCNAFLRTSNSATLGSVGGSYTNGTSFGGPFTMTVLNQSSLSSQVFIGQCVMMGPGSTVPEVNCSSSGSSAISLSGIVTLNLVVQAVNSGGTNASATVGAFAVIVNP